MASFSERLSGAIQKKRTPVLVGLDPRWEQLPARLTASRDPDDPAAVADAFETFCRSIIAIVAPLVPAVKPQAAFVERFGPAGMGALASVIHYAQEKGLLVILDGKRNDIGSTASAYAAGILGRDRSPWSADALTVSPYLGDDSLTPFIETAESRDAGIFILVKTSNPGGKTFQDLVADGKPIYRHVAEWVEGVSETKRSNNGYSSIGAVVGATWPQQLTELRETMKSTWFLVPGYGSQGGGAKDVAGAFDANGLGAIINNSRGIIFAYRSKDYESLGEANWEKAVESATLRMIDALASETPAGALRG